MGGSGAWGSKSWAWPWNRRCDAIAILRHASDDALRCDVVDASHAHAAMRCDMVHNPVRYDAMRWSGRSCWWMASDFDTMRCGDVALAMRCDALLPPCQFDVLAIARQPAGLPCLCQPGGPPAGSPAIQPASQQARRQHTGSDAIRYDAMCCDVLPLLTTAGHDAMRCDRIHSPPAMRCDAMRYTTMRDMWR